MTDYYRYIVGLNNTVNKVGLQSRLTENNEGSLVYDDEIDDGGWKYSSQ